MSYSFASFVSHQNLSNNFLSGVYRTQSINVFVSRSQTNKTLGDTLMDTLGENFKEYQKYIMVTYLLRYNQYDRQMPASK